MDIFTHISQFWAALIEILWNITTTLTSTTEAIDSVDFTNNPFVDYMGYAKYSLGDSLWIMLSTVMIISVGTTVYKIFLNGVYFIKDLLVRI